MAVGVERLPASGRAKAKAGCGSPRSTVREVCLIGLDRRASAGDWTAGDEVTWLGRKYEVVATAGESPGSRPARARAGGAGPGCAGARRYVHLASRGEN